MGNTNSNVFKLNQQLTKSETSSEGKGPPGAPGSSSSPKGQAARHPNSKRREDQENKRRGHRATPCASELSSGRRMVLAHNGDLNLSFIATCKLIVARLSQQDNIGKKL